MIARGCVVEPLRDFYKDQVREIGRALGISKYFVERWPFPGPGLAIRCLCSDKTDFAQRVDHWDHYDGLSGLYELARLPLRSVGVQGDARTYRTTLAVKGPLNKHDLTALARQFPEDRIVAHLAGIHPLTQAQVYPATVTPERVAILREADHVVRTAMMGYEHLVWQFPVVLLPLKFSYVRPGNSIVLRPVASRDGMTADFVIPPNSVLDKIIEGVMAIRNVDAIFLDVSDKPPATIEWE
jgi:GMP synthase (glutamine-hydrolysing)